MKLKVKHGWMGFLPLPFIFFFFLGYAYVLLEPVQLKYYNNTEGVSFFLLILASIVLGAINSFLTLLSLGLHSVWRQAPKETEVDKNWAELIKNKNAWAWTAAWIIVFLLLSFGWYLALLYG
jgi:hypothetical protein